MALIQHEGPVWSEFYITDAGRQLRQKAIAEQGTVYFTGAQVGEGKPADPNDVFTMTELVAFAHPAKIKDSYEKNINHVMSVVVDNETYPHEVLVSEVCVLAKLGTEGAPVLYGYAYCVSGYAQMPAAESSRRIWTLVFDTHISHSSNVTIVYDSSAIYATPEDIDNAVERHNVHPDAHMDIRKAILYGEDLATVAWETPVIASSPLVTAPARVLLDSGMIEDADTQGNSGEVAPAWVRELFDREKE